MARNITRPQYGPAIFLLALLLIAPTLFAGPQGSDLLNTLLWERLFSTQFWQGEWYPRWLMEMYAGHGSPVFYYYPPLAYHITALFDFLSFAGGYYSGYYCLAMSALVAVCVSGLTFYYWMKEETGSEEAALTGSLLYIATPAYMAYCFYFTLLFSSVWVYAWLPLLMRYGKKLATGEAGSVRRFALSLSLLMLTNVPQTIIWGPIAVAHCLLHFRKSQALDQSKRLALALALGFGLAAIFLLPACSYLHYTIIKRMWTEPSTDYHNFFIRLSELGTLSGIYGCAWILMLALTAVYYFFQKEKSREFVFFAAVSLAALFMLLPISRFIWDSAHVFQVLQFPQRFFLVPSLGLAVLAALALPRLRVLSYGLVGAYLIVTYTVAFWPRAPYPNIEAMMGYNIEQHANYFTSYNVAEQYYDPEQFKKVLEHNEPLQIAQGKIHIEVTRWEPRRITLYYKTDEDNCIVQLRQFYFPGLQVYSEGNIRMGFNNDNGQIVLNISKGHGFIDLIREPLGAEFWGTVISAISFIILSAPWAWRTTRRALREYRLLS